MRKGLVVVFFIVVCFGITGCGEKNSVNNTDRNVIDDNNSDTVDTVDTVTLNANNEYFIISDIDFSKCTYDKGYFKGYVHFNSHTTEKYVKTYNDYFYRELYFDFIDSTGSVVGSETTFNNYIYSREYRDQEQTYVLVKSKNPITEVRLNKIVLSKADTGR